MKNERGSVLVQVLITTVIVSTIAAGLMQLALLSYTLTARAAGGAAKKKSAESAFNSLMVQWNSTWACNDLAGVYTCVPNAQGTTACTCTPTSSTDPTVVVTNPLGNGNLTVEVTTPDS